MDKSFSLKDLTSFEKLVAPKVLKVIYWIGLVGIALWCLFLFGSGLVAMQYSFLTGLGVMLGSVIGLAVGVLFWRVMIEMYMTFFGIYERLGDIRESLKK